MQLGWITNEILFVELVQLWHTPQLKYILKVETSPLVIVLTVFFVKKFTLWVVGSNIPRAHIHEAL